MSNEEFKKEKGVSRVDASHMGSKEKVALIKKMMEEEFETIGPHYEIAKIGDQLKLITEHPPLKARLVNRVLNGIAYKKDKGEEFHISHITPLNYGNDCEDFAMYGGQLYRFLGFPSVFVIMEGPRNGKINYHASLLLPYELFEKDESAANFPLVNFKGQNYIFADPHLKIGKAPPRMEIRSDLSFAYY
ncbi:MAG: hypothetical protein GXO64_01505 [Candidatus Micrarchaeota archaeon]|nr:hypothetical protein [Candidatus Micrarchaeota archaeon]